jgi:hypothetical protein
MLLTGVQLFLTIGIPTFAILIGILTDVIHHNAVKLSIQQRRRTI